MTLTPAAIRPRYPSVFNMADGYGADDGFRRRLADDLTRLRQIAGLNIQRAARIAYEGDDEVAQKLIDEAAVMLTVAINTEKLLGVEG